MVDQNIEVGGWTQVSEAVVMAGYFTQLKL